MRSAIAVLFALVTLAQLQAATPGQPLLEKYAYSPERSWDQTKALMDEILKLKLTDADFFGQYRDGVWVKAPMLDYAYSNAVLRAVEAAAKTGDYGKAATALLAHFRTLKGEPAGKPFDWKKNEEWKIGCHYKAVIGLRNYIGPHVAVFKQDDCTPADCVEYLKRVALMGMQLCNGYSDNLSVNGLGGNMVPARYSDAVNCVAKLPELADGKLWIKKTFKYMMANMHYIMNDDGSYIEHTFGYPRRILPRMMNLRDVWLAHGLQVPDTYAVQVHKLARYLMFCALPTGDGINWGEGYMGNFRGHAAAPAAYFNDPELLWYATRGAKGRRPAVTDVFYPQAVFCVFRSSWEENANFLFFAPRSAGSHAQTDQNMIELYAFGRRLLIDTGSVYDGNHPAFNWLRAMNRSQNTVEVDEQGYPRFEKDAKNRLQECPCGLKVAASPRAGYAQGWGGGYPTVRHEREVFFIKETGMSVIRDILKPQDNKTHTYDQCWHFDPVNTYESDAKTCRVWTTNKDAANLDMVPVVPGKSELLLRDGWCMRPKPQIKTTYPSFRQKTAGNAEFVTVIRPTPAGAASRELKAEQVTTDHAQARAIRMTTSEGAGVLILSHGAGVVKAGEVQTDAGCAYVQFDAKGEVAWAVRSGGSSLTVGGKKVGCEVMKDVTPPGLP